MEATAQLVQLFSIYLLNMLSVHNYVCHISFCNVLYVCIYIYIFIISPLIRSLIIDGWFDPYSISITGTL